MSFLVQLTALLCLCFFVISVTSDDAQDLSISRIASDLLAAEQAAVTNTVKEWTLDWQSDIEDVRSSLSTVGPPIDAKNLLEDILVGEFEKLQICFKHE